jgi:mannose-6-phosphate isomerase-like protein (cupin superfamily)
MSYGEPVYLGDAGEKSAILTPADADIDLEMSPGGTRVHYLATGATTGGKFGMFRWDMGPQQSGASPHFHRTMAESFFVLNGAMRLFNGDAWIDATAGDYLYVPEGGIHGFRNESGEPASMLILFSPGKPREGYFEELAEIARSGRTLTEDERVDLLRRHDQYMVEE